MNRTSQTAQGLASKGRYGDSMLVHMNPQEVAGLASLAPGQMTINPETGLPEAFSFTKLFDRIAPIAIPLALGAATGGLGTATATAGAGAGAGAGAAGGIFSNPLVQKSLFQGLTSAALAKMRGADTSDALNAGLTSGLVYGAGAKLMGVGAQPGVDAANKTQEIVANSNTAPDLTNPNDRTISNLFGKDAVANPLADASSVSNITTPTTSMSGGVTPRSDALMAEFDRKYPEFKDGTFDDGSSTSGGISGFLKNMAPTNLKDTALMAGSTYAGQAMLPSEEEEEEKRRRRMVAMTKPYQRNVSYPDGGYGSREYRYFQEGGAVNATAPVEDTPEDMGLGYYAPLIASYGADTSLPPMAATMPAGNYTTPTAPMAPMGGGMTPISSVEGTYFTPPPERKLEVSDSELLSDIRERRAPEGFMWSANTPNIAPGVRGDTTYKLFPTKNLSRKEMQDLTSKGILTRYRPERSRFSDYQPQVEQTEGSRGGEFGRPIGMQEGGITSLPQTEGQVDGRGDGMEDQVFGDIDGEQEVALSKDEFIVPADVVAGLGNGSSNAGASQLYEMMDRVRMARTGKKTQPPEIEAEQFMPA